MSPDGKSGSAGAGHGGGERSAEGSGGTGAGKSKAYPSFAYKSVAAWLLLLVPAVAGIAGDQWLKAWAFPDGVPGDPELMPYAGRQPG